MGKTYKLDRERNIGTVVFILEGAGTEFDLLETVFVKILGYQVEELKRNEPSGDIILRGNNPYSRVIGLNLKGNHLGDINDPELNALFHRLSSELGVKPEDAPVYFLYDRDVLSYEEDEVRSYAERFQDPYANTDGSQGQLLLSYPALESYLVSCFQDESWKLRYQLGKDLKTYAAQHSCQKQMLRSETHLSHAAEEMDTALENLGCGTYDLDALGPALLAAYDAQQESYKKEGTFSLLSLFSMALLELGILVEEQEEEPFEEAT